MGLKYTKWPRTLKSGINISTVFRVRTRSCLNGFSIDIFLAAHVSLEQITTQCLSVILERLLLIILNLFKFRPFIVYYYYLSFCVICLEHPKSPNTCLSLKYPSFVFRLI